MLTTRVVFENRYPTVPAPDLRDGKVTQSGSVESFSSRSSVRSLHHFTPAVLRPWASINQTPARNTKTNVRIKPSNQDGGEKSLKDEINNARIKQKPRPSSSRNAREKSNDDVTKITVKQRPATSQPYDKSKTPKPAAKTNMDTGNNRQRSGKNQYVDTSGLAASLNKNSEKVQTAPKQRNAATLTAPSTAPPARTAPSTARTAPQPWSVTQIPEEEEPDDPPKVQHPEKKLLKQNSAPSLWSMVTPKRAILVRQNTQPNLAVGSKTRPAAPPGDKAVMTAGRVRRSKLEMYFNRHRPLLLGPEQGSSGELFEILTTRGKQRAVPEAHHGPPTRREDRTNRREDRTTARRDDRTSVSSDDDVEVVTDRRRRRHVSNKPRRTLDTWTNGPDVNSDEYDTELEEDFPAEPDTVIDATGAYFYETQCEKKGIVPVRYLLENMGEGNLRMRHHYLGGQGTKPLAQALKKNTITEEIDLSDNFIEGQGAAALAETLKDNMFIVNLNVSNNFIKSEGAEKMAEMLEANTTLKTLSLQGNQLSDQDARRISEALKNNMSLSCMDLSHNQFGEAGGVCLAQGIAANIGLADLDLSWNCIREKGAVAIAKALAKNTALEILDLSWNGLAHVGAVALASALRVNKSLKVLDISNNRLNPDGAVVLGKSLARNMGLETLLMGLNPIGAKGVEAVLKGAAAHPRLKLLGIENTMDLSMEPHLVEMVKSLEGSRDIMIMATTGPPQHSRINATVLAVFDRFLTENADRMEDLFRQMDKDGSGDVTLEELKYGLKDFGLRLTSKQLDTLLDELDSDKSGTIEYEELMKGSALIKREKEKIERAAAEALMFASNLNGTNNGSTNGSTVK